MEEIWKPVPGWEWAYEASSLGRIRSLDRQCGQLPCRGRIISPGRHTNHYLFFNAHLKSKKHPTLVHRAVCSAFHGPPPAPGYHACHKNGSRTDNRPENLMWATRKENESHKIAHGTLTLGERNGMAVLTADQVREIRCKSADGIKPRFLAREYSITAAHVGAIKRRKAWQHIDDDSHVQNTRPERRAG